MLPCFLFAPFQNVNMSYVFKRKRRCPRRRRAEPEFQLDCLEYLSITRNNNKSNLMFYIDFVTKADRTILCIWKPSFDMKSMSRGRSASGMQLQAASGSKQPTPSSRQRASNLPAVGQPPNNAANQHDLP